MVAAAKNRKLRSTDTGAAKYLAEAQIAFLLAKKVIVSAKYLDFANAFFFCATTEACIPTGRFQ